ncbi:hypothetical protein [Spiroplasma endosymbiont of Aspidapion aeneum]|uniref:hypothetical protein n=1 Tax=Spiroplasma endosymbiont of Aspidapion aeneum TaxID=3066276 RepID=UPI00313D9ABA
MDQIHKNKRYKVISKLKKYRFNHLLENKEKIFKELEEIVIKNGWASLEAYWVAQALNMINYSKNKKIEFAGI